MGSGVQRNIFNWINLEGQGRFEVCEGFHLGVHPSILPYQLLPSSTAVAFCN
jgi:hypothetical protein